MSIFPVTHRSNGLGHLELGGVDLVSLAQEWGTPLYVVDAETLRQSCAAYTHTLQTHYPDHLVVYAGKAGLNKAIIRFVDAQGLGLDVVSGGELYTALQTEINPEKIFFHGNNKSEEEITMAIQNGVTLVLDHEQELALIREISQRENKIASLMVRLKPEIEAHTHDYIKTGQSDSKFGIEKKNLIPVVSEIVQNNHLRFEGIHSHIGSQIFERQPFEELVVLMVEHCQKIKQVLGIEVKKLNLGGGIGIAYTLRDDPFSVPAFLERMTTLLKTTCTQKGVSLPMLILEPGRSIMGNAGITLYRVGAVKDIPSIKTYVFVDGGMADNPRPMLYQAEYTFALANKAGLPGKHTYSIAGKYCESGDILAEGVGLPTVEKGDLVVVYATGAYNYAMASTYNRNPRPAMVMVDQGQSTPWVRRETFQDLAKNDL